MENVSSPLDPEERVELLTSFYIAEIIEAWQAKFDIDVAQELNDIEKLDLYQCNSSKLRFFLPTNASGSDDLYAVLSQIDWYYMPHKWEHRIAIQDLSKCNKVIEVGCGPGSFVERLRIEHYIDAYGVELNPQAVKKCNELGIPVFQDDLSEIAEKQTAQYDAVCSFQVLEHVPDPLSFLSDFVKLLKPGGYLIISVPNQKSFIQYEKQDLFNMPPHHMTQWQLSTFQYLEKLLPIKLQRFAYEPLAEYHVGWYLSVQCSRFSKYTPMGLFYRLNRKYMIPIIRNIKFLRNFIIGHTLYVVFQKDESFPY